MSFNPSKLYVIAVINNPVRFKSRQRLFFEFKQRVLMTGANLIVVEAAFQDRPFFINNPDAHHPDVLHVIQRDELWLKENLINIGMSRLPSDAEYVAWIDGDVEFTRPDWAVETIHQLQHYKIVQMFQTAIDLGPNGEALEIHQGFGYSFVNNLPMVLNGKDALNYDPGTARFWHPGFAWAANVHTLNKLGGLIDKAILGAGDHHMALALIGMAQRSLPPNVSPEYDEMVMEWEHRCNLHVKQDIGYVSGTLLHNWHGKKADRRYATRWEVLQKWHYNPVRDIKADTQGVFQLTEEGNRMRNDLRTYFRQRNEDSIDLE